MASSKPVDNSSKGTNPFVDNKATNCFAEADKKADNSTNPFGSEEEKGGGRPFEQHYSNKISQKTRETLYGAKPNTLDRSSSLLYPW